MPSRGKSQLAMNAPTMPMAISPIRPVLAPRTILPASQPAMRPTSLTVSEFLTSTLSRDCRDAARAARQHCHESSAQSPPNGGNRIRNVPFRPQWRTPLGGKLREL
jgi:hypothetical protein